ncbi:MAG: ATP-binding protein [Candidatus Thorarchaeota archaeon]|jgi:hypothetical protein
MTSPYFISVDPSPAKLRMFFGRRGEIQAIVDYLRNGDSILLIGERRMGKTFLLYMLGDFAGRGADFYEHLLDRHTGALLADLSRSRASYHWAFVDLLGVTSAAGFYFKVLAGLAEEQVEQFLSLSPMDHMTFASELTRLSKVLSRREQRAVVLVDEGEKLLDLDESADVFSCLKAVVQQCDSMDFLLAGDIKPYQETPEFVNLKGALRPIYLAPLDKADAKALIQVPVKGHLSFEDLALQRILELTGGKPSLVQILCGHLYELVTGMVEDVSEIHVTLTDFDRLWESELREKVFESFDCALKDFFEGFQGHERSIFSFLAHNPLATVDDIVDALGIQSAFARRGLYRLHKAHRIEEVGPGFRISAKIVEEFGSRFVPCPIAEPSQRMPVTVVTHDEQQESVVRTNLRHHAEGIVALIKQWKGVKTQDEIESWLLMFEDDERDVAIKLLSNTKYYSQEDINRFLKILHGKFMRTTGQKSLKHIWFFGVGGASKSGQMMLYLYRTVNGLSASHCQDLRIFPTFAAKGIQVLAFVDDFIGTGQQVTKFWHEELKGQCGIEKVQLYCLVLCAFQNAVEYVQAQTPFRVICVELLDKRDRVFSPECTIFSNDEERKRAEEICRQHGEVLCSQNPLGYDDSQALVAFGYQTPNNSLPILWSNAKGWIPIFERKS